MFEPVTSDFNTSCDKCNRGIKAGDKMHFYQPNAQGVGYQTECFPWCEPPKHHLNIINNKLTVFCADWAKTAIDKIQPATLEFGSPKFASYKVFLNGVFGQSIVRVQIMNNLYCECKVLKGHV